MTFARALFKEGSHYGRLYYAKAVLSLMQQSADWRQFELLLLLLLLLMWWRHRRRHRHRHVQRLPLLQLLLLL
jgi:hypothetical protein